MNYFLTRCREISPLVAFKEDQDEANYSAGDNLEFKWEIEVLKIKKIQIDSIIKCYVQILGSIYKIMLRNRVDNRVNEVWARLSLNG